MIKHKIILSFITVIIFFTNNLMAEIPAFETTRLKSTAGAGVGSILMDESSVLNPASIAFFNVFSLYFQTTSTDITMDDDYSYSSNPPESSGTTFILSDGKGQLKGSVSYINYNFDFNKRKRIGISMAGNLGKNSALGVTYLITEDEINSDGISKQEHNYKQFIVGVSHAINEKFTFGVVLFDPEKVVPNDTYLKVGGQYHYLNFISLMLDLGGDFTDNLSDTSMYAIAAQFKLFSEFYLRVGLNRNSKTQTKGSGIGVSWIQPKLVLEIAHRTSEPLTNQTNYTETKDTSFSVSFRM